MILGHKNETVICLVCALALMIMLCFTLCGNANAESPFIETEGLSITSFIDPTTENYRLMERQKLAHTMADCARQLGYPEDCEIIKIAKEEWNNCEAGIREQLLETQYWMTKFEEYPYATYIWLFFTRQMGFSNEVTAGIMGNIMTEVGANTLNIQYWLYSYNGGYYYGICQWAKNYFPDVRGMDLIGQVNYLAQNIETQITAFGKMYKTDTAYQQFLDSTNCRESALMFAKWYEACAESTYYIRQNNAEKAYEYFVGVD